MYVGPQVVLCMLGYRLGPATYVRFRLHTGCVVLSGSLPIGGSDAGKGGVAHIAAHSSPTGLREAALPETVL